MATHVKRISQLEARTYRKRCEQMEERLKNLMSGLITAPEGSVPIAQVPHNDSNALLPALIRQSHQFGHAVIATVDEAGTVIYYALQRGDQ